MAPDGLNQSTGVAVDQGCRNKSPTPKLANCPQQRIQKESKSIGEKISKLRQPSRAVFLTQTSSLLEENNLKPRLIRNSHCRGTGERIPVRSQGLQRAGTGEL